MADLRQVLESAARTGVFGEGFTVVDLVSSSDEGEDQFASDVVFAQVKVRSESTGRDAEVSVVIKKQQKLDAVREMMCTDQQFYNEHLMYSELLPFLERDNVVSTLLPRWYHSHATLGKSFEEDIIVVEDLSPQGFRLTEDKVFLDLDHCLLAMKALGKFHALSYAMKHENREEFLRKVASLKEVEMKFPDPEDSRKFLLASLERGVLPLIEAGDHVMELRKFLERVQDPISFRKEFDHGEEPMAVLCHGDFNRNNMLFRYGEDGRPTAVKLFDMATSRYTSPAVDLAFFLYMNTTAELRAAHWDELLEAYHDSLSATTPLGCPVPSLQDLQAELRRRGVYGYIITSFFLPMMLDNAKKEEAEEFLNLEPEEALRMSRERGGEPVTRVVTDVVRHLLSLGAI